MNTHSCTKQCGHVDTAQSYITQCLKSRKISDLANVYDYLSKCNCSRLYRNKKFMYEAQYKLDFLYTNDLEAFEKANVDMCPYAIKMFGDHILNCKCELQKCTRSGKKY